MTLTSRARVVVDVFANVINYAIPHYAYPLYRISLIQPLFIFSEVLCPRIYCCIITRNMSIDGKLIEISKALDNAPREFSAGSYVLRNVNPENGQPTLALNSTTNTDFLLPNTVYNLNRSYLNFNLLLNDTAGTAAARWNHAHNGFLAAIDGIILSSASGVRLVELNNVAEYTKIAWRPQTDLEEYMTFPCHSNSEATVAAVTEPGQFFNRIRKQNSTLNPVNATLTAAIAAAADVAAIKAAFAAYYALTPATSASEWINGSYHISNEAGTAQDAAADDHNAVSNYISASVTTNQAGAGALGVRVQLPLKLLYGSLLAVDRDLYFGEQLRLTIRWNQGAKFGYLSATSAQSVAAASVDLTEAPTISSVVLKVAVETNDAVAQGLMSKVNGESGVNLNIPFTHVFKYTGSATASDTSTAIRKLNRGHGAKLLRVLCGIYSYAQTGARYCSTYNYGSTKWTNYRTMLDSKPIQDDNLAMSDMSAFQYQAEKLKGSVIKDSKDWAQCPTIIEDFSGIRSSKDYPDNDHVNSGLDLSSEREFALQFTNGATIANALNVYIFAVCQKHLNISKSGIQLM